MRYVTLIVFVLAGVAGFAGDASACSCAVGDPRRMLAEADGAFVGTLVERRDPPLRSIISTGDPVTLTFEVERAVKGTLPSRIEVVTAASSASCGIEARVGQRIGLFLDRDGDQWRSSLCQQIAPDRLLGAAGPLPAPEGSGTLAVLVGGSFGDARVIALDADGRTLGYGRGAGETLFLDACPGSRRAVEIALRGRDTVFAVRDLRTLRVLRERPLRLAGGVTPAAVECRNRSGESALLFATREAGPRSAIYRLRDGTWSVLHRGSGVAAAFGATTAYLTLGAKADRLLAVDLRTGSSRSLGAVPSATTALALSPDGRRLAGVAYSAPIGRAAPPSRVIVVDLRSRPLRRISSSLGASNLSGRLFWLANDGLAYLPHGGERDAVRVYDAALREQARIEPWVGWRGCVRGRRAYALDGSRVVTATLPAGRIRRGSELPSPTVYTLAPVPGNVRVSAPAPAQGTASGRIVPAPRDDGAAPGWPAVAVPLAFAAALVLGALVWLRRRPRPAPYPSRPSGTA